MSSVPRLTDQEDLSSVESGVITADKAITLGTNDSAGVC